MKKLILLFLLTSSLGFAKSEGAHITKIKGNVYFGKTLVKKDFKFTTDGILRTGKNSYVQIKIDKWKSTMSLGSSSQMQINITNKKETKANPKGQFYSIVSGIARWVSSPDKKKPQGLLLTKNAVLGIRGTDYIVIANPLLGETEVVVFDGKVQLYDRKNKKENKMITKNQWGGLGGRFGNKIGEILTLPKNVIDNFKKQLEP